MQRTVCVIDDDELITGWVSEVLGARGWHVLTAHSVAEGLEVVRQAKVSAVLVDILMPDQDGLEGIARLREQMPDIRIVAISGGGRIGSDVYLDLARVMGAHATLRKPLDLAALEESLTE